MLSYFFYWHIVPSVGRRILLIGLLMATKKLNHRISTGHVNSSAQIKTTLILEWPKASPLGAC